MTRMTAGTYLRLRREAAGLSLAEAARSYVHHALAAGSVELLLREAEADLTPLGDGTLGRLRLVFAFDPEIYLELARGRTATVCRVCACSWNDPCVGSPDGHCAWTDSTETLCTACAPAAIVRRAERIEAGL